MNAQQEFAKILDDLKERYTELLIICDGQYKQIEAAKPIIEKWCKECSEDNFDPDNARCECDCGINDLKALLFPRSDEQKKCHLTVEEKTEIWNKAFQQKEKASDRVRKLIEEGKAEDNIKPCPEVEEDDQ
jgi:hypothetical protein